MLHFKIKVEFTFFEKGLLLCWYLVLQKKSTPMRIEDGRTPERTSSSNLSTIPATFRLFQQPFDYPGNFSIIQQLFDFRQRTSIVVEAQYPKLKVSLFNFDEKSPKSTKPTYAFFFSHEVVAKTGSYCAPITTVWRGRRFRNREAVLSYEIWFYLQKIECFPHQKIEFFPLRTCFFCYVFFPNFCLRTCLNAFFKLFSSIRGLLTKTEV